MNQDYIQSMGLQRLDTTEQLSLSHTVNMHIKESGSDRYLASERFKCSSSIV